MDSSRWQRVQTLFHEAADLPAAEQLEFLEKKCSDDEALVSEVLILLQEDSRGGSLLERDVAHVAHQVLASHLRMRHPSRNSDLTESFERWAKAAWAWCTWPSAKVQAVASRLRCCAMLGFRRQARRFATEQRRWRN